MRYTSGVGLAGRRREMAEVGRLLDRAADGRGGVLAVSGPAGSGRTELAFHYCHVPEGQPVSKARLIRAAGLRWPVEECFELSNDHLGLDQSQVRLYTAITRHTVLVMAALVACAVTAALLRDHTDTQAPPPVRPDQPPPADLGMIPLTIPEITRLLTRQPTRPAPPGHAEHWANLRRRHQARSRWYHQRSRLARDTKIALISDR